LFVLRVGVRGVAREGRERGGVPELELGGGNEADAHPDLATLQ